jgi:hypothetical protein
MQKMVSALLLLLLAQSAALLRTTPMTAHKVVMRDSDRCYYGEVDDAGNVDGARRATKRPQRERAALRSPDPALSPLDVVEQQFQAFERGSFADVEHAFAHVSPAIVDQYALDAKKFGEILKSIRFEGVLKCSEWSVTALATGEDTATAKLTVLPAPIPGCVRTSGVADQGGITWPTHFEWILKKQADGCWMLDTMNSEPPPMGDVADAEPLLASHYQAA